MTPKPPTLAQVNTEIRKVKLILSSNINCLEGIKWLGIAEDYVNEIERMIEHNKQYLKMLDTIKEKLI